MLWIAAGGVALMVLAFGWCLLIIGGRTPPPPPD
jgi:hypothetical protein